MCEGFSSEKCYKIVEHSFIQYNRECIDKSIYLYFLLQTIIDMITMTTKKRRRRIQSTIKMALLGPLSPLLSTSGGAKQTKEDIDDIILQGFRKFTCSRDSISVTFSEKDKSKTKYTMNPMIHLFMKTNK